MIYELNIFTGVLILIIIIALLVLVGWLVWAILPKKAQKKIDNFFDKILK